MIRLPSRSVHQLVAALLPLLLPASASAVDPQGAERVIERLDASFLEIMQRAEDLGYRGRYDTIAPVVRESFDLVFMARAVVGRHWQKFSEPERQRWIEAFEHFLISTFAHRFDGYSGQSFEILGRKAASQNTLTILTRLNRPEGDDVRLDYRMRERPDSWKIVDIYSNGTVSEVAMRHAECSSLLKKGGIEKLIASISETTERHASE